MKTSYKPTLSSKRIQALDVLRGFALFGILMVNMSYMNNPMLLVMSDLKLWDDPQSTAGMFIIKAFFESKFFVLFSFLFGYGFWLFLRKENTDGLSLLPLYRRRLFYLFLFGAAHVILLWPGDILVFYALFGFILILFRNSSDRKVIKWAIGFFMVPVLLNGLLALFVFLGGQNPDAKAAMDETFSQQSAEMTALVREAIQVYSTGTFAEMIDMRLKEYVRLLPGMFFFYPYVLVMFLLGLLAARRKYLENVAQHLWLFRKLLLWGLAIGVPLGILYALLFSKVQLSVPSIYTFIVSIVTGIGGPLLMLAYLSGIVLLLHGGYLKKLMEMFATVGRMALTNYLMQSLITSIIFLNWGFGYYGKVNVLEGIALTILIYILQIIFSSWWLKRYKFGPLEWLWRSLTYNSSQPMRKEK